MSVTYPTASLDHGRRSQYHKNLTSREKKKVISTLPEGPETNLSLARAVSELDMEKKAICWMPISDHPTARLDERLIGTAAAYVCRDMPSRDMHSMHAIE